MAPKGVGHQRAGRDFVGSDLLAEMSLGIAGGVPVVLDGDVVESVIRHSVGSHVGPGDQRAQRGQRGAVQLLDGIDPRRQQAGEPPLVLDSAGGKIPVHEYMSNETRFRMVEKIDPARFRRLAVEAQNATQRRIATYEHMAKLKVPVAGNGGE